MFVDVRSGEESFVRLEWKHEIGRPAIPVVSKVRPTEARREIMYPSYVNANKVHSSSVPKIDPREPPQLWLKTRDKP